MTRVRVNDFLEWFGVANSGESYVYHSGLLVCDRDVRAEVAAIAECVWRRYEQGEVTLVQRRAGNGCDYYAIKIA